MKGAMSDWKDIIIIKQKYVYESSQVLSQPNNPIFIYAPNICDGKKITKFLELQSKLLGSHAKS